MIQDYSKKQKIKDFISKYGYLIAVLTTIVLLSIVIAITANASNSNKVQDGENKVPVSSQIVFDLPMLDATIYKEYNGTELVYNSTLKQWEAHKAIDFVATSNANVYAVMDGVVKDVYSNYLEGTVVVLEHANGLTTSYGSLDENVEVEEGDTVKKGDVLGKASESASRECGIGAYLHFTTFDNEGKKIDPSAYLNLSSK